MPIPDVARQAYRALGDDVDQFGDPFQATHSGSYFRWLTAPLDNGAIRVSRLWQIIYDKRPDVRQVFPDLLGKDREAYLNWTVQFGAKENGISEEFLARSNYEIQGA